MAGRRSLAAAFKYLQTPPCDTVKEGTGILTPREALKQCMCV